MVERLNGIEEVRGSNPLGSMLFKRKNWLPRDNGTEFDYDKDDKDLSGAKPPSPAPSTLS